MWLQAEVHVVYAEAKIHKTLSLKPPGLTTLHPGDWSDILLLNVARICARRRTNNTIFYLIISHIFLFIPFRLISHIPLQFLTFLPSLQSSKSLTSKILPSVCQINMTTNHSQGLNQWCLRMTHFSFYIPHKSKKFPSLF